MIFLALLLSCFNVSGNLNHYHEVDVRVKFVDDTGDSGDDTIDLDVL